LLSNDKEIAKQDFITPNTQGITIISLVSLLFGHLMINTFIPNEGINFLGLVITSLFIYQSTLAKKDIFSFVMVIYFCSTFPLLPAKGGGFNLVAFFCIGLFLLLEKKLSFGISVKDKWFNTFTGMIILSSALGWIFNFVGNSVDYIYSIVSFFGIIFLLLITSKLELNTDRIKIFLKLNFILIIYSTLVSLNKYLHIITFNTPMMPLFGDEGSYFEGGGLIGNSPLYGEHSMILLILFSSYFFIDRLNIIRKPILLIFMFLSFINVFMSISRSVFLLSSVGLLLILVFQYKINKINVNTQLLQISLLLIFGLLIVTVVSFTNLNYVFDRIDQIEETNEREGGISIERIIDGSAFNREIAFKLAKEKYQSRNNWVLGYGWGLEKNNRYAFYNNINVNRGSAHSQIFCCIVYFWLDGFYRLLGINFSGNLWIL
jgi:hypothetical protein